MQMNKTTWLWRAGCALLTSIVLVAPVAAEKVALPAGRSVVLNKHDLSITDAQGKTLMQLAVRADHLDTRVIGDSTLVATVDANRGVPILFRVSTTTGRIERLADLPAPGFEPTALCLYQDGQKLLHLFLLADNGISQQWLLRPHGAAYQALLERQLATPLEPKSCSVDDVSQTLLVAEAGVGVWAYRAEAEGAAQRRLLASTPRIPGEPVDTLPFVEPLVQTEMVSSPGDAADDPAIWEHPADLKRSRILGTDKKYGLMVYDLSGRELQRLPVGRINNVDLRQSVRVDDSNTRMDLAVATHRDRDNIVLFSIDRRGSARQLAELPMEIHDLYGVCAGRSKEGFLDVVVNNKDGELRQVRIQRRDSAWHAEVIRRAKLETQPEACVFDEVSGRFFVAEEKRGVWSFAADPEQALDQQLVLPVGGLLHADVEGLGIYRRGSAAYLLISSQGNHSFLVMDLTGSSAVRAFRIGINATLNIDGVSETDGLAINAANFGARFPGGLLVVQDGHKNLPTGHQNFKYVSWEDVRRALNLP